VVLATVILSLTFFLAGMFAARFRRMFLAIICLLKLKLFGLKASATLKELKNAYRKLAKKYHPDRNTGTKANEEMATKKMVELNLAYDWLVENW